MGGDFLFTLQSLCYYIGGPETVALFFTFIAMILIAVLRSYFTSNPFKNEHS